MGNMSYCRFENTYKDLADCLGALKDGDQLSETEHKYRNKLIAMCKEIADDYEEEDYVDEESDEDENED